MGQQVRRREKERVSVVDAVRTMDVIGRRGRVTGRRSQGGRCASHQSTDQTDDHSSPDYHHLPPAYPTEVPSPHP
jgi:hypothetical protein